ncbi:MAG TPA: AraC family transcriptional regulator [Ramlibacter sp.]|jgi:AraC-like DNA-binding protein|uniref:AraC family transcriptional regulator n=1 Tax=Ramlibacter sp. TaxID=1917967 RepID=UPI002D4F8FF7|nr:AraC family transcriptional regulator [Ramlibacter sp.]HZY17762.1 AraC family transcriptional regulator [Ramlibacter sp.]
MAASLQVELLPRAAYSASDTAADCVLGIALEPQRGVHAIDSDRRADFHSRFGELSFKPAGLGVFSESAEGGEYLLVRTGAADAPMAAGRPQWLAGAGTLGLALQLRAGLLGGLDAARVSAMAEAFVCHAWNDAAAGTGAVDSLRRRLQPVLRWIEQALEEERTADLRLEVLAGVAGQGTFQFLRAFSRAVGMTPHAYVSERRLQLARRMARMADAALADVAAAAGYASQSHMGASFRRALGLTPAAWRARGGRPIRVAPG